jgi:hypothetical protein
MVSPYYSRSIDPLRTNVPVTDNYAAYNAAWNTGAVAYGTALRAAVGTRVLVGNGNMKNFALNGNIFEDFPTPGLATSTWNLVFVGPFAAPHASYPEWSAGVTGRDFNLIQVYGAANDYQLMRYGLTSALMNDGSFSYSASVDRHAADRLDYFDEFDNAGAGRGYLGQPTGAAVKVGSAYRRDYTNGIALVNPSAAAVTVQLGGSYRKIKGSQDPVVNDGTTVTSVTIPARDGIILLKPAPVLPPAPIGTLTVAAGAARVTAADVAAVSAVTGAADMRVDAGSGTFGAWTAYAPTAQITLAHAGVNVVRVEYRNAGGTIQLTDTVELIVVVTPPAVDPTVTVPPTVDPTPTVPPTVVPTVTLPPVVPPTVVPTPTLPPVVPPTVVPTVTVPPTPVPATVTLRASSTIIDCAHSTTLQIAVLPAAAVAIRLEKRSAGQSAWTLVTTMTSYDAGLASMVASPLVNTDYRVVLADGTVSPVVTIQVKALATVRSSRRTVSGKRSVTFAGTVSSAASLNNVAISALTSEDTSVSVDTTTAPPLAPVRAVLQRKVRHHWVTVKAVSMDPTGSYRVRIRPPRHHARYSYRIYVANSATNGATASRIVKIRVR